jgi:phosphoribosylformylglycinamidine (FGAM) synthase PurS component
MATSLDYLYIVKMKLEPAGGVVKQNLSSVKIKLVKEIRISNYRYLDDL